MGHKMKQHIPYMTRMAGVGIHILEYSEINYHFSDQSPAAMRGWSWDREIQRPSTVQVSSGGLWRLAGLGACLAGRE